MDNRFQRVGCFFDTASEVACSVFEELRALYANVEQAYPGGAYDLIITLGGDGVMLRALHRYMGTGALFYGLNLGSVGFLLNEIGDLNALGQRIATATNAIVHPLLMEAETVEGIGCRALAINEVSVLRQTHQSAKMDVFVNNRIRLTETISDGILVATPAGSTAYNCAAYGPIVPLQANVLLLTPISPFRPRRWRGAILSADSTIELHVLEWDKRPVSVAADFVEFRNIKRVSVRRQVEQSIILLFDSDNSFEERVLKEQFSS